MATIQEVAPTPDVPSVGQSLVDDSTAGFHFHNVIIPVELNSPAGVQKDMSKCKLVMTFRELLGIRDSWYELVELEDVTVRFNFSGDGQWLNLGITKATFKGKPRFAAQLNGYSAASNKINAGAMQIETVFTPGGVSKQVFPTPSNLSEPKLNFSCSPGVNAMLIVRFKIHGAVQEVVKISSIPFR